MLKMFIANLKMLFRNRQYAFWAIMFPLMFTCIFGFFFGSKSTKGSIILINNANTPVAETFEKAFTQSDLFMVSTDVADQSEARKRVESGKVAGVVVIPEKFGEMSSEAPKEIKTIIDPSNTSINLALSGFLNQFITDATFRSAGIEQPAYKVSEEKTNSKQLNYFDFVLAGILGLSLMNSSIMSIAVGMSKYREEKILKRITTTPIKVWWFISGEVLSRLVMSFIQVSLILAVGRFLFGAHIYGNIFVIYALAMLGGALFQLIGFVLASFVKTTQAAEGAATAITIPMMFLGGVFFPIDTLPKWLLSIVQYLPIAPLLRIIRSVTLEGKSPFVNSINITIVFIWIIACLVIASWKFRLNEE